MPSPAPARLPDPPLARPAHNAPRPVPAPGALSSALPAAVAAALWRADQLGSPVATTWSSGFEALDAVLPGGGWPGHGVTEILSAQSGTLEWRLLGPLLRQVCAAGRSVVLVGPPRPPHPPGLRLDGIAERQLVWVMAETPAERLWSTEQLVKANACGALIAWLPQVRAEQVRRLQVLAAGCAGPVFLCRPATAARESSAAPLRRRLQPVGCNWLRYRSGPGTGLSLTTRACHGPVRTACSSMKAVWHASARPWPPTSASCSRTASSRRCYRRTCWIAFCNLSNWCFFEWSCHEPRSTVFCRAIRHP